jgi:hypothetical protein
MRHKKLWWRLLTGFRKVNESLTYPDDLILTRSNDFQRQPGGKANRGIAMYTQVTRDQFEVKDDSIIHTPTGAEFSFAGNADSVLIWTGGIGRRLASGDAYRYAEVVSVMKTLWRDLTV